MLSSYYGIGGLVLDIEEFDKLLIPRRAVLITGPIDDDLCEHVQPILLQYALESAELVTIIIDSPGGDVRCGLGLFDYIRALPGPTKGIAIGTCSSMAVPLLQACTERTATEHTTFVLHELSYSLGEFARDRKAVIEFMLKENLRYSRALEKILLSRSRLTLQQLRKHMREGELYRAELSARQTLKLGLIDRIITQPFAPTLTV